MTALDAAATRSMPYHLIDEADRVRRPLLIIGRKSRSVLCSDQDWNATDEILYQLSLPGMSESIDMEMTSDLSECAKNLDWQSEKFAMHGRLKWMRKSLP